MNVVLADEFRDGNVPAQMAPLAVAKAAFAALPSTVKAFYYRGDVERGSIAGMASRKTGPG